MKVLIIGGGGFIGGKLAAALAARGELRGAPIEELTLADLTAPPPVSASFPVRSVALDIANRAAAITRLAAKYDVIYHLAAIVSSQAEAEFDVGMQVNLHGALNVFDAARAGGNCPVVVFASSIAVYGGDAPQPINDWTALNPQTSYGAQKAAAELFLTDYSRKGFFDGRGLRLPTITIRPGKPNRAASSFMSSIFREPMQGRAAVCPVSADYTHWFLSPRRCVENLIIGAEVPAEALGSNRCFALPGQSYRIGDMVDAMRRIAGEDAAQRIRWELDSDIGRIVSGWPERIDAAKALSLGFVRDESFEDNVRYFLEDDLETQP